MATFDGEEYEALCVAMAMLDAAHDALNSVYAEFDDDVEALGAIRNGLNQRRIEILGNKSGKPYHVGSLLNPPPPTGGAND